MTARHPELRNFLGSFHGQQVRAFLTTGQDTTGILNTTTWSADGPTALYLVSTEDPELAAVLIPWHAVAAIGKILPNDHPRPRARGDEPAYAEHLPPIPPAPLTPEQADEVIDALRAENTPPEQAPP
jgi:hypothetical protein